MMGALAAHGSTEGFTLSPATEDKLARRYSTRTLMSAFDAVDGSSTGT
jgi:hypothetical protein